VTRQGSSDPKTAAHCPGPISCWEAQEAPQPPALLTQVISDSATCHHPLHLWWVRPSARGCEVQKALWSLESERLAVTSARNCLWGKWPQASHFPSRQWFVIKNSIDFEPDLTAFLIVLTGHLTKLYLSLLICKMELEITLTSWNCCKDLRSCYKNTVLPGKLVHTCNPNYLGGGGRRIWSQASPGKIERPYQKDKLKTKIWGMTGVVVYLPSKVRPWVQSPALKNKQSQNNHCLTWHKRLISTSSHIFYYDQIFPLLPKGVVTLCLGLSE
jgi:hypothetical protein